MHSWWLTPSQIVTLACAPLLMVVVSWFESRWGPKVAGIVAAAPLTALIGLLLVQSDLGADAGQEMAFSMSGYVPAQVGVAVVVVALGVRFGYVAALSTGVVAYTGLATLTAHLPITVAIAASVLLLLLGPRLIGTPVETGGEGRAATVAAGPWMVALRAGVSLATALGLLVAAQAFGPAAGGAIGAFPVFTFTLCSFLFATTGHRGVHQVLAGMVQGLPPYFAFVLSYGLAVAHVGAVGASIVGGAVCATCYLAPAWRSRRSTQADDGIRRAREHRAGAQL